MGTVFLQERLHVDVDRVADKAEDGTAAATMDKDMPNMGEDDTTTITDSFSAYVNRITLEIAHVKAENDLDTTTASAVVDAKTPWETTQIAKKSLNKVLADATAAKITAEGSADVEKKLADDDFGAANEAALASQTNAIAAAKASCDDAWKIAQALKTTNDNANEESCKARENLLEI